ncbi:MAG: outer rane efflux protein [Alphaproteobacteria bacterium]|jgi:outer membrane protein TolC|nr:outer rane efflux protein [Alphaproteobacteria bacterium]
MYNRTKCVAYALPLIALLAACSSNQALEPSEMRRTIAEDMRVAYPPEVQGEVLTLEMAIARGIKYNLDAKVAQMENYVARKESALAGYDALPTASLTASRIGRNNPGGSSSRSLQTGVQSLEPSISTDQYRNTASLDASWNLLDAGLAIARARGASDREKVSMERRRKVFEDVVTAVYAAYWRAAAAQRLQPQIRDLIAATNTETKKLDAAVKAGVIPFGDAKTLKGTLLDKRAALMTLKDRLLLAEAGLKALIALPPGAPLRLDISDTDWLEGRSLPRLSRSDDALHSIALMHRPEMHEQFLNKSISARNVKLEIFSTFPGASAVLGAKHDANSFLAENDWVDWTFSLTQSITKLLTLPARYQRAKADQALTEKRRAALVAAVMTQVTLARLRFEYLKEFYAAATEVDENSRQLARRAAGFAKTGMMATPQKVVAEIDAAITGANRMVAFGDAQEAYAQLVSSLGIDIWSGDGDGVALPEISSTVRRNLQALENDVLTGKGG